MLRVLRVTGDSLLPDFKGGDYVVIATVPFLLSRLRPGDTVVFGLAGYGTLIKRVARIDHHTGVLEVEGTHPASIDSRSFGPIRLGDVLGKVLWHIRKPASRT